MTKIKVGSKWNLKSECQGSKWDLKNKVATVVWADDQTVVYDYNTTTTSGRCTSSTGWFVLHYELKPKKVTHVRWVNMYSDGSLTTHNEIEDALKYREMYKMVLVSCEKLTWTVTESDNNV